MLYQLGALTFRSSSPNLHETELEAESDYAAKDVIGTLRPLEPVGEGQSLRILRGRLFPRRWGGLTSLALLEQMRVSQEPQILVGGDGENHRWWVVDRYRRHDTFLDRQGVGRVIEYEVHLRKSPTAATPLGYFTMLMRLIR